VPLRLSKRLTISISAGPPPGGSSKLLGVPYLRQEQTNWCWAACCEMVFSYYKVTARQCEMATYQFGRDCCRTPSTKVCNQANWPENIYAKWRFFFAKTAASISSTTLCAEIDANRPVEVLYKWRGRGAHVALICGYYENGDVEVHDPWYGQGRYSFPEIVQAYGRGTWTATYTGITN
jgi:ABC-type bacteriocin/lantibiotic exporter with double-glycine peptidase domain